MRSKVRWVLRKIDWNSAIIVGVVGAAAVLIAAILPPIVSHWLERPTLRPRPPRIETRILDGLEKISQNAEYEVSQNLTSPDETLEGILVRANQSLFAHYAELKRAQKKGSQPDLVYLIGPAGCGKSTLLKVFRNKDVCSVDLGKEFGERGMLSKYSTLKPDLQVGEHVFNKLPGLRDQTKFSLSDLLKGIGCCTSEKCKNLVILDGLDELHPELAKVLLEVIDSELRSRAGAPLPAQILVAGRPEGFHYYLKDRSRVPDTKPLIIHFELPKYTSRGALNVLLRDLYGSQGRVITPNEYDAFASLISSNRWLSYTVGYMAYARFINEYMRMKKKEGVENPEGGPNLKATLFDNMLENNYESHGRPQTGNALYVGLLEEIAARNAEEASKHDGYFEVSFEDTISLYSDDQAQTKIGTLRTREILNRSGIAFLDPADFKRPRYRFQPQWIHRYLAERWNNKLNKSP